MIVLEKPSCRACSARQVEVLVAVVHLFLASHLPWFAATSVLCSVRSKDLEGRLQPVSHRLHSIGVVICSANDEVRFVRARGDVRLAPSEELAHADTVGRLMPQCSIPCVCRLRDRC
jgi:hypothetical protein